MFEVDQKLMSELQPDGRTTLKELGELTDYTSMGIKNRLEGLQEIARASFFLAYDSYVVL